MTSFKALRDSCMGAMKSKIGGFLRRADGGAVPGAASAGMKKRAFGGNVAGDMGVDGAPAPRNLGKPGISKGKKGNGKKGKGGKTTVNVVVAPKEKDAAPAVPPIPPIPPPAAAPPMPPIAPPAAAMPLTPPMDAGPPMGPGGPIGAGGPPMPPPDLGGGAPIPMRKSGGRVNMDAGAGSGEGRLEKIKDYGPAAGKAVSA